jgi:hypothetical protein
LTVFAAVPHRPAANRRERSRSGDTEPKQNEQNQQNQQTQQSEQTVNGTSPK